MSEASKSVNAKRIRIDRCFNPFDLPSHRKLENLRRVSKEHLIALNLSVTDEFLQQKICNTCRIRVVNLQKDSKKKVHLTVSASSNILKNYAMLC